MASASSENFQYGYPTPGPQSPTGQDVMDHVYFVSNTEWKSIIEVEQFDYVVIGTGPCGLAFVERILSRHPQSRILVLERGGYFLPEPFPKSSTSICQHNRWPLRDISLDSF